MPDGSNGGTDVLSNEKRKMKRRRKQQELAEIDMLNPHLTAAYLNLDAEKVLNQMGKYGRYQMFVYAMSNIGYFLFACETLVMSLVAAAPEFACELTEQGALNRSLEIVDRCTVRNTANNRSWECGRDALSKFAYENVQHNTLVTEYDLVCSHEYWSQHGTSVFMTGGMITTPILIQLADRYGRRFTFLIPLWITVLMNIACSVAPSYFFFLVFRFFAGLGTAGLGTIGFVIMIESVAPSFRSITPLFSTVVWVGGYMAVGILHILVREWRWVFFVIAAPCCLSFTFYWFLPESLPWLISNNKTKQIKKYIRKSSRMNKIEIMLDECKVQNDVGGASTAPMTNVELRSVVEIEAVMVEKKPKDSDGAMIWVILRHRALTFHLLLHCFVMITMNFTYWALSLFSIDLHEDEMVGYFLSGAVELPAGVIAIALLSVFGRRTVTFWALFAQSLAMFAAVIFPGKSYFNMCFPLAAKIFNSVAWTSQPLLLGEMSPTPIRNTFYGSVGFVGEIGSIFAPYFNVLKIFHESAPQLLISIMSLIASLAILCSPETMNKPMPQTINDFDPGPVFKFLATGGSAKAAKRQASDSIVGLKSDTNEATALRTEKHQSGVVRDEQLSSI